MRVESRIANCRSPRSRVATRPAGATAGSTSSAKLVTTTITAEQVSSGTPSATSCLARRLRLAPRASRLPPPTGITLMEVLISMFVLLFGLMGVAAIFPVGNHYVVQGEKFDRGNALATNAFEEMRARGMLDTERWLYAGNTAANTTETGDALFIDSLSVNDQSRYFRFNMNPAVGNPYGPGNAFVIDPMGAADTTNFAFLDIWPINADATGNQSEFLNPWINDPASPWYNQASVGQRWPVRRITLPSPIPGGGGLSQPMPLPVAESIFRLRDDLQVELPENDDHPGVLRWRTSGNLFLTRDYQGNFSWMATVVPLTLAGRDALEPADRDIHPYEVSVVIFYKRVNTPTAETERLVNAELLTGGELVMYDANGTASQFDEQFRDVKPGDWLAVMGVNQTTGAFMLKWYRMLALDEEAAIDNLPSGSANNVAVRRAMLLGPDWHYPRDPTTGIPATGVANLRVAIIPGVASVVTREMELERSSLWSTEQMNIQLQ